MILLVVALATPACARAMIVVEAGTPLAGALDVLRDAGLRLVYSSELVPAGARVQHDETGTDPLALARIILEPHGLELRPLGGGVQGVVTSRAGPRWIIAGRIVDEQRGVPIANARLELDERGVVAWSDESGRFSLRVRGREAHRLQVIAAGYDSGLRTVQYQDEPAAPIEIPLIPSATDLEQITVVASRYFHDESAVTSNFMIERSEILAQPKIAEDALQVAGRLPGFALSGVSARPNVRGGETREVLVTLDGMPIREPYHLPDYVSAFSAIDETLVDRIDAFTGALPTRYGNRLGSVLALQSVEPDGSAGNLLGLSTYNAKLRYGRERAADAGQSWLAAARVGTVRSWIGAYATDIGRPKSGDLFLKSKWRSDTSTWQTGALLSASRFSIFDPDTTEFAVLSSKAAYFWTGVERDLREDLHTQVLLGFSTIHSTRRGDVGGGLSPEGSIDDRRNTGIWDLSFSTQWRASRRHLVEFGVDASSGAGRYQLDSAVTFDPVAVLLFGAPLQRTRNFALRTRRDRIGAYFTDRIQVRESVYGELGLRVDRLPGISASSIHASPQLSLRWDATPTTTLRASWARSHQAEEAQELRVADGVDAFSEPERADHWVLSVEKSLGAGLDLRIEAYRRSIANPRVRYENLFDPLRFIPELSSDRIAIVPDWARLEGVETSLQMQRGAWSIWGAYTFANARDRIGQRQVPRDWDQRHTLSASVSWKGAAWTLSALTSHHSGRPNTPFIDDHLASAALGPRNSARLPRYFTIDVRAMRSIELSSGRLVVYGQVSNLLNRGNRCCTEIDLPSEDSDPTRLEIERVPAFPLIPAVGIQWEY